MTAQYQNIFQTSELASLGTMYVTKSWVSETTYPTLDEAISDALFSREDWRGTVKIENGKVSQVIHPDQADLLMDATFPERKREYHRELARSE